MSSLPTSSPQVNSETAPFWEGTAEERLCLPRCTGCGSIAWYPRSQCIECRSETEWEDVEPTGAVYSYTVVGRGQGRWRDAGPYVVAYVDLDVGPRMLTNIVECDPSTVTVGMRVTAVFDATDDGPALVRFTPVAS